MTQLRVPIYQIGSLISCYRLTCGAELYGFAIARVSGENRHLKSEMLRDYPCFLTVLLLLLDPTNSCELTTDCGFGHVSCCHGVCTSRRSCDTSCVLNEHCDIRAGESCLLGYCMSGRNSEKPNTATDPETATKENSNIACELNPACDTGKGMNSTKPRESENVGGETMVKMTLIMPGNESYEGTDPSRTTAPETEKSILTEEFIIALAGLALLLLNIIAIFYCISRAGKKAQRNSNDRRNGQNTTNNSVPRIERGTQNSAFIIDLEGSVPVQDENLPPYDFSAAYQVTRADCSTVENISGGALVRVCTLPPPYSNRSAPGNANTAPRGHSASPTSNVVTNVRRDVSEASETESDEPPPYHSISSERLDILPPSYEETLRKPDNYSEVTTGL